MGRRPHINVIPCVERDGRYYRLNADGSETELTHDAHDEHLSEMCESREQLRTLIFVLEASVGQYLNNKLSSIRDTEGKAVRLHTHAWECVVLDVADALTEEAWDEMTESFMGSVQTMVSIVHVLLMNGKPLRSRTARGDDLLARIRSTPGAKSVAINALKYFMDMGNDPSVVMRMAREAVAQPPSPPCAAA